MVTALEQAYVPAIYYFGVAKKVSSMLPAVRHRPGSLTYISAVQTIPSNGNIPGNPKNGKPLYHACSNAAL
jgi:hypothetical protein